MKESTVGSEDTVLATDPEAEIDAAPGGGAPGVTLDLPSNEPDHQEAAPNVLRPKPVGERYRLGVELGRGGMGRVVEAFDVQLGRTVALKEVLPQISGTPRRFAREVQITARLEHPAIVPLYDAGMGPDGRPYYVMRRVSGRPLDELIARAKSLDERLVLLPAVLSAIDAIAHAHKRGVIHRDLKPANILVGDLGETVVIDWGLAKVIGEKDEDEGIAQLSAGDSLQTQFGSVFGTPGFMSPEQARGEELGTEGDVYALGATLYQLLAGRPPHAGKSATELLASTHKHEVRPLDEVAPHAPMELCAIVEKALQFAPDKRYANAAQLGEDVRRFTAGQLVKAHRYTRVERLQRFAKKNRAALTVTALAMVTLAILAWIGIARIMTERNAANVARDEARSRQAEAEAARDAEADRAEMLTALRARSLLDTNPTEAIAVLKDIAASKKRGPEVAAIAKSAIMRGVAWALETPLEITTSLELSPDGNFVAQGTRDGTLLVWDLVHRKRLQMLKVGSDAHGYWAGDRVIATSHDAPPIILDPATGKQDRLAMPAVSVISVGATHAAAIADGKVYLIDAAARSVRALDLPGRGVAMAPDDAFFAAWDSKRLVVLDLAGAQLSTFDRFPVSVAAATKNRLVVASQAKLAQLVIAPAPVWTDLALDRGPVFSLQFGGDDLLILTLQNIVRWNGTEVTWQRSTGGYYPALVGFANGYVVLPRVDGRVEWARDVVDGHFILPMQLPHMRVATHPDRSRVVVSGDGILLVYDLAMMSPQTYESRSNGSFFIDDSTIAVAGPDIEWAWRDVTTGKTDTFELIPPPGLAFVSSIDPKTSRLLVTSNEQSLLFTKGAHRAKVITTDKEPLAHLVPNGPILIGRSDGRVMIVEGDKEAVQIAKVDGSVDAVGSDDRGNYAAYGSRGELVRGNFKSNDIERLRVPPARVVALGGGPRTPVGLDDRLYLWEPTGLVEIAKFESPVSSLVLMTDRTHVLVILVDRGAYLVNPTTKAMTRVMPSLATQLVSSWDGKLLAGIEKPGQVTLVDLPSLSRWSIPTAVDQLKLWHVSPTGRYLSTYSFSHTLIYKLPEIGPNLPAELARITNAISDGDIVVWPWQRASASP